MSMPPDFYPGPQLGPPVPPSMLDMFGINSLYAPAGQSVSPSILAGVNAPSAVDSLYAAASGSGGAGARFPALGAARQAVSGGGFGPFAEAAGFPGLRAGFGRALPGMAVASFGPQAVNAFLPGNQDSKDIVGNTVAGLGLGMTAAAFAPEFAPFLIPGGAAAGLGKGLYEQFFGDNTPSGPTFGKNDLQARRGEIQTLMDEAGIPLSQQDRYLKSFTTGWNVAPDDATRQQGFQSFQQSIASQVANQVSNPTQLTPEQILATQALTAQVMKPYTDRLVQSGADSQALYNGLADAAPNPQIAALARTMGGNRAQSANSLAAAYEQQALMLPSLNALQLANQYGQQAFAAANRATSSGSTSLQALLAQAQAGGLGATGYTP